MDALGCALRLQALAVLYTRGLRDDHNPGWSACAPVIRVPWRGPSALSNRTAESSPLLKGYFHTLETLHPRPDGPAGCGKSTLVDQLARYYRRTGNSGSLPSTRPAYGRAILGDRIRMQEHYATRGSGCNGDARFIGRPGADYGNVATVLDAQGAIWS
jgi:hypothetical protein